MFLPAFFAGGAIAQTASEDLALQPIFESSSSHIEYLWHDPSYDFRLNSGPGARAPIAFSESPEALDVQVASNEALKVSGRSAEEDEGQKYADKILEKIPYSKQLKSTWKVIDGDVDLYVKGLRIDRGNKGLEYKTDYVPFMGSVEGVMFKAEVGEDSKMKLESSHIPFVGDVDGFKFKSSVGEDASVSLRYTTSFEKLGL